MSCRFHFAIAEAASLDVRLIVCFRGREIFTNSKSEGMRRHLQPLQNVLPNDLILSVSSKPTRYKWKDKLSYCSCIFKNAIARDHMCIHAKFLDFQMSMPSCSDKGSTVSRGPYLYAKWSLTTSVNLPSVTLK